MSGLCLFCKGENERACVFGKVPLVLGGVKGREARRKKKRLVNERRERSESSQPNVKSNCCYG